MKRGIDLKKKKRQIGTGLVTACLIVVMGAGPAAAEAALLYADQTKTEETADESAQEETEIWQEETESWSDVSETQTERKTQTKTSPDKSSASLKAPVITTRINGERPAFSWKPVKGAAAYEVWRKDEGAWKKTVLKGKYWIYFSDRKAAVGHPVRYKVRAVGRDKSCSDFSPVIKLVKHPDIPAILSLKKTRISWHKVTGADYYQIYMKKSKNSHWKKIGTSSTTSFKIRGSDYSKRGYYTVRAVAGRYQSDMDPGFQMGTKSRKKLKVLIDGDSITAPYCSWAERSCRKLKLSYTNRAVNGSRISSTAPSAKKDIYKRSVKKGFKGYDLIILSAGTNDYGYNARLGSRNSTDPETFYGAWNRILKKARRDAPKAKIIICTPQNRGRLDNRYNINGYQWQNRRRHTLAQYANAEIVMAKKYKCLLYRAPDSGVIKAGNVKKTTVDLLHPTRMTHIKISEDFIRFLETL